MVGPGPQSLSQSQSQSQSQPLRPSSPPTAEEEAIKRNTDCVYFLASPLTCKKGSECEYRHSDVARVNPRDCYFWLNGNCLNTKCSFRHPPLDVGAQGPTPNGPSLPLLQTVSAPIAHSPNTSGKPGVPCIFFQKGFCLKGDWCPFVHGPNSSSNKTSHMPGTAIAAEPATFKKTLGGLEKRTQDKKAPPIDFAKSTRVPPQAKPSLEVELAPSKNEFSVNKRIPCASPVNKYPGYRTVHPIPPVANGNPFLRQPQLLGEPGSMTGMDAEEVSRDPSPGFDVLVDDKRRDSDYYPNEDHYRMTREHETRNEYNVDDSTDYNSIAIVDNERYQGPLSHDSNEHFKDQYAWEHKTSSERMPRGSPYHERRPYARIDSLGQANELDLRHRLTKHKKTNGLRSVISHEHNHDRHAEDRRYQGFRGDEQNTSRNDISISSRLRGRIRLPGRSSSPIEREIIRSSDRGRLSPVRATTQASSQGRFRDRIKGRVEEAPNNDGKYRRGLHLRRDMVIGDNSANFAPPKSLAELKNMKNVGHSGQYDTTDQQSLGKRKHLILDGREQSDEDLAFEGPKPLKEILKRKKGDTITNDKEESSENNKNEKVTSVEKTEGEEESNKANLQPDTNKVEEAEEGIIIENRVEQESDYEQVVGGEDFELYEGDNGDGEAEEYVDEDDDDDDDDDDDFAKKMGVMYS